MKRKRFSEEQIIRILHEAETLDNVREVCRHHNVTEQTVYRWRRQFGGMEVADAKRLRTLERENAALKRLDWRTHAGQSDAEGGRRKKLVSLAAKRQRGRVFGTNLSASASDAPAACLALHRSTKRRQPGHAGSTLR